MDLKSGASATAHILAFCRKPLDVLLLPPDWMLVQRYTFIYTPRGNIGTMRVR